MFKSFAAIFACVLSFFSISTYSQTLSLNDGSVVQSNTNRIGLNIGAIDYYDNGQILKNLIGSINPGFEPLLQQQIWALTAAGSATTFTVPDQYDGVPPNYWTGGTFTVVESQSGGAELGCTGTIASNTGPNYPLVGQSTYYAPTITVSSPCNASFSVGDTVIMSKTTFPTPESWWETGSQGGIWGSVSGGAQLLSDTTDLCATCGTQSLNMNASTAGSSATANWYFDSCTHDNIFVMMNGTYQLSFWAKAAAGAPVLTATASRLSQGGFNCGTYSPKLTSSWAQYTWNCTAAESQAATSPGMAQVAITTTGGSVYLDNVSFEKTSGNPSNTTVLRDEVIETLQKYYGPSIGSNPGMFRYWVNQNAEDMNNWTQPDYAHGPTGWGTGYFISPGGNGSVVLSLEDYLVICQLLNAQPYLEVPVTFSTTDAANLIEFLASPSGTTYGSRRAALGQSEPWTSVFSQIHLSFCNECWNGGSFPGESLAYRSSVPNSEYYYDYSLRARDIFAAMHADPYYSQSSFDLVMNAQTAVNASMDTAIARAHPDSIEIEGYTYSSVSSFATDAALWQPAMVEPYEKVTNPSDVYNFYQSVHDYQSQKTCGASGTAACNVNMYEWGQGTVEGSIDQQHMDYINAGAGEGVVMALQPLLNLQYYGIKPQNFFSLDEYRNGAVNGLVNKLWGNIVDMGGATNNVRPEYLGLQLVNQSIIGPMYSCPIANNATYNFAGSPNGISALPALNNVPYLYAFCFENGSSRSLVLINTDLSNNHTISFSGTNPPQGTVTQRQYAPAALDDMNEAPSGSVTNQAQTTVALETTTLSSPGSITLPPYSVTALDYTAGGASTALAPTFLPAAGTYTTSQSVTISDATSGTTIYYTTNGTTPTTSSNVYSGAITVSATETLEAIAVETGYVNSPAATATYTIAVATTLPAPTISPAAGTYTTSQSVTISDATSGTTIYYTTNGTTPTTSSSVYNGAITVSATETIEAIAVKTACTNSSVATAAYTITATTSTLPAPTLLPAGGNYTTSQSVTISDATAGTTIYYTTNGTTPTTSSNVYSGAITVSATETVEAIAVETGYANSAAASASYTISSTATGLLAYELFGETGTTPFALNAASGGDSGWNAAWVVQNGDITVPGYNIASTNPLSYTNLVTTGQYAVGGNNWMGAGRQLNVSASGPFGSGSTNYLSGGMIGAPGTTIWISFLLRQDAAGGSPYVALTANGGGTVWDVSSTNLEIGAFSGMWGLQYNGTTVSSNVAVTTGQPALLVLEETFGTTNAVNLYVNPTSLGGTAPAISSATYSTANSLAFESFAYYGGNGTNDSSLADIRIGPSYAAVTPASLQSQTINFTAPTSPVTYPGTSTVTLTATATSGLPVTLSVDSSSSGQGTINGSILTITGAGKIVIDANQAGNSSYSAAPQVQQSVVVNAPTASTPTFSLAAGTYTTSQSVTISDATAGTTIYYTTNGTTPTTSSTVYSGAITVNSTETLEAIAVETGYTNSATASVTYTIAPVLPTPTFSLAAGTYTTSQSVTISDATAGTTIYYTTNGTTPTTSSSVYSSAITVSATETMEAIAVKVGNTNSLAATVAYTINLVLPTPTFSLAAGTYTTSQSVTISDATAGTTIYYTTNGTTPTTSSTVYSGAITVSATETLEAIAVKAGNTNSLVATVAYTINSVLPAPTFSLAAGSYSGSQSVTISDATAATTIYYTTNGTTPTTSSTVYSGAITVSATETLEAIAVKTGYTNSAVATAAYTIVPGVSAPVFSPTPGTYTSAQNVTISDATSGAAIYYTTNGTTPTTSSTLYTGGIWLTATQTLKAIAVMTGYANSPVTTAAYAIAPVLPSPTFSPQGGGPTWALFTTPPSVTLSDTQAGVSFYYTTNGTTPTTSSTLYTGPITVTVSETIEAIAVESGYSNSPVSSMLYSIAPVLPAPTFSVAAGTYSSSQTVSLSDTTAGTTIYYTTNGSTPTTSSTKYTGAITVNATETVEAIAVESGYCNSTASVAAYTISGSASLPAVSDFTISASTPSAIIMPGGSAAIALTVSPLSPATVFPAAVSLLASGLPAGATYTLSPSTVAEGAGATAVTLTVQLPQATASNRPPFGTSGSGISRMAPLALALLLLPFAARLRNAGKRLRRTSSTLLLLASVMVAMAGLGGCGALNSTLTAQSQSYSVTVIGTTGSITKSTTVTLTVKL
jgi:hypothetical protein